MGQLAQGSHGFSEVYGITSEETPFVTYDLENPSEPFELAKGVL